MNWVQLNTGIKDFEFEFEKIEFVQTDNFGPNFG